jgi:hypothetical protein
MFLHSCYAIITLLLYHREVPGAGSDQKRAGDMGHLGTEITFLTYEIGDKRCVGRLSARRKRESTLGCWTGSQRWVVK